MVEEYTQIVLDPEEESVQTRNRAPAVERGLRILNPEDKMPSELAEEIGKRRVPYAQMHAHMELAAMAIATGATAKQAAGYAGISVAQLKKKYLPDSDFRERVQELRTTMMGTLAGRILKELLRRTDPTEIQKMELLDLLRIGDRAGLARGAGGEKDDGTPEHRRYENILQVFLTHSGPEGGDFPIYQPNRPALPGEGSPVEG